MKTLKSAIAEVEKQELLIKSLTKVKAFKDYKLLANQGYSSYYFTPEQMKRVSELLNEFESEMEAEVLPKRQKLNTLEQLIG